MAVPSLQLVRRRFPDSEIRLLSNEATTGVASVKSVLADSGLTDGFFGYEAGSAGALFRTWRHIRAWAPELLVYLMPPRSAAQLLRDWLFFRSAGIPNVAGLSFERDAQVHRVDLSSRLHESEASRLARNLRALGTIDLDRQETWSLGLKDADHKGVERGWRAAEQSGRYVACGIGSKVATNDWGIERWSRWAQRVSAEFPGLGLVMVGGSQDFSRSDEVIRAWTGPARNLCGRLGPRETAAAIEGALIFAGHDSGPMHLAGSVGTPAVAVFSARNEPGIWYPHGGDRNAVLYHKTPCYGCKLAVCTRFGNQCIRAITVDDVVLATRKLLQRASGATEAPSARP